MRTTRRSTHPWLRAFAALAAVAALAPALASTGPSVSSANTSTDLEDAAAQCAATGQPLRINFTYDPQFDISWIAALGLGVTQYPHIGVATISIPASKLGLVMPLLKVSAGVKYAVPNRALVTQRTTSKTSSRMTTAAVTGDAGLAAPQPDSHVRVTTGAGQLATDGTGVTVAVVDSGVEEHADFRDANGNLRIVGHVDFTGEPLSNGMHDGYGHGTHVAGLVAGNGSLSAAAPRNLAGVAKNAQILDVRVLKSDGTGSLDALFAALEWIAVNGAGKNVRVINLSLGTAPHETFSRDPLCQAVERLVEQGFTVVVAAGNDGKDSGGRTVYGGINSPGNDPKVITVGAVNTLQTDGRGDDLVTTYSSRGPTRAWRCRTFTVDGACPFESRQYDNLLKPDVVAPGNRLVSTLAANSRLALDHPDLVRYQAYLELSGTSMATPVVAGLVAQLLQARADLSPAAVKAALMYTAQPVADGAFEDQGAGEVDAVLAAALAATYAQNPGTLVAGTKATPGLNLKNALTATIAGQSVPAGRRALYVDGFAFLDTVYRTDGYRAGSPSSPGATYAGELVGAGVLWANGSVASATGILWANNTLWIGSAAPSAAPLGADGVLWSDGILWSDSKVTGNGILWSGAKVGASGILWGNGILWSDGTLQPTGVTWADGVLWADTQLVGEGVLWGDGVLWSDGVLWAGSTLRGD